MSSYQVFARKYRPQTFDSVVGQEHITQTLKNAIAANRLAHAYLFVGPRGTGKTSTARILAKALNCVNGPTVTPCGECDACKEIAAGNSLDVLEIDGASNNGVEQVRELRENVRFAPTHGKYKIYIIDEVHMLTTAAFNALLKTLEEPPPHVKFIFATTDVQKVLPTILSRCQRFDLRRIPARLIAEHLQYIAGQEKITLEPEAAQAIAKGAEGGLRDAESMLDQLVAFCGETITEADVLSVFGFTAAQTVAQLCGDLLAGDSPAALGVVQQQAQAGRDLSRLMADLISHLRNLLVAKADPEGIQSEVGPEAFADMEAQAGQIPMDRLLDLIEQFAAAEGRMKWAPNKKLHFEIAVIKAIQTLGQATLTEVLDTLTALKTGGELPAPRPAPVAAPRPRPIAPAEPEPAPRPRRSLREAVQQETHAARIQAAPEPKPEPKPEPAPEPVPEPAPQPEPAQPEPPVVPEPEPQPEPVQPEPSVVSEPEPERAPWEDQPAAPAPAPIPAEPEPAEPPREEPSGAQETLSLFSEEQFPTIQEPPAQVPVVEEPDPAAEEPTPEPQEPAAAAPAEPEPEPVSEPEPQPAEPAAPASDLWPRVVAEVHQQKPFISGWVQSGTLLSLENGVATLGFPESGSFAVTSLDKPAQRKLLESIFTQLTGQPVAVQLKMQHGLVVEPVKIPTKAPEPVVDPMEAFQNDPLIRHALEIFKAEIQAGQK
ncbi:MAG: DNA polymerase III subunit gamma/tau [Chthoniobacteraceae bacterium]|nr:DNA polymerase III subunit gamma/tau [Chthoniobacteraceae bacterium]